MTIILLRFADSTIAESTEQRSIYLFIHPCVF